MINIGLTDYTAKERQLEIKDKSGAVKAIYSMGADDIVRFQLMNEHFIQIAFELNKYAQFKRADYIEWKGNKYTLRKNYKPEQENKTNFKYTLVFEATEMFFQDITFYYLNLGLEETTWGLTTNPATFMQIVVDNINRYYKIDKFLVGTIDLDEVKFINFDGANVFDGLTEIARVYEAEWYLTGYTLHLVKKASFGSEIPFELDKSIESISRESHEGEKPITRMLPLGSTRNIPANYRKTSQGEAVDAIYQKRLRIPEKYGNVIDAYPNMSPEEAIEDVVIFEDIYPKRIAEISDVTLVEYEDKNEETGEVTKWNAYRYKDKGLTFKEEYILPNIDLEIVFQSGKLNGLDFKVKFNPDDKDGDEAQVFEIYREEKNGKLLPNDILKPENGDKYVLRGFDISLVGDQYVPLAEEELYEAGIKAQKESLSDKSLYDCKTVIKHFHDNDMDLEVGQRIGLIHEQFEGWVRSSRIQGYEKKLLNPFDAVYTVADNARYSRFDEIEKSINELRVAEFRDVGTGSVYLIKKFDNTVPSDFNVFSALRQLAMFIRRDIPDTFNYLTGFNKGLKIGNYAGGMIGGSGGAVHVNEYGETMAELDNMVLRQSLTVPKITFNNIDVVSGDKANTFAFGTIKKVDTATKIAELDLLNDEVGTLKIKDICRGVFHNLEGGNREKDEYDENGYLNYAGFSTSYFTPVEIIENKPGKLVFRYELQAGTTVHPMPNMNFFAYGNFEDKSRQALAYENRYYTRYLAGVSQWKIEPNKHLMMQTGLLDGLSIGGMDMEGYGTFLKNIYMTGVKIQFTPQQLEELKGEDAYSVHLTQESFTVRLDANDNIIGGLFEDRIVTTEGKITTAEDKVVTAPTYKQITRIQAHKGTKPLFYANEYKEGAFLAHLQCVGCTAEIEAGEVKLTDILSKKEAYIILTVICEGNASFERRIPISFVRDGAKGSDGIGKDGFSEVTLYKTSRLSPSVLPSRTLLPKTDSLQESYHSFLNYWSYGMPTNLMLSLEFELGNKQFEQNGFTIIGRDHGKGYERNDVRIKFKTKTKQQKVFVKYTHSKSSSSNYTNSAWLKFNGTTVKSSTGSTSSTLELIAENIGEQVLILSFTSAGVKNSDLIQIEFISPDFEELPVWETTTRVLEYNDGKDVYFIHYDTANKYTTPRIYSNEDPRYELQSDVKVVGTNSLGALEPSAFLVKQMAVKSTGAKSSDSYYMTAFFSKDGNGYSIFEKSPSMRIDRLSINLTTVAESRFIAVTLTDAPVTELPTTYIDKLTVPIVRDGENLAMGSFIRNCGIYNSGATYYWSKSFRDVVRIEEGGHRRFFALSVFSEDGIKGDYPPDSKNWIELNINPFMAIELAMIDNGDIAGFLFKNLMMISRKGVDKNGKEVDITEITDISEITPYIWMNGKTGEAGFGNVTVSGGIYTPFRDFPSMKDFWASKSKCWNITDAVISSSNNGEMYGFDESVNGGTLRLVNTGKKEFRTRLVLVRTDSSIEAGTRRVSMMTTLIIPEGRMFSGVIAPAPYNPMEESPNHMTCYPTCELTGSGSIKTVV